MIKLYETNSYLKEWETEVEDYSFIDNKHCIVLKETAFFPEEGGQYADTGLIIVGDSEISVLDGYLKDGLVWHVVSSELTKGTRVLCKLDWEKRFSRMQNHSGEHIMVGLIHIKYGYDNVGFHLSDDGPVTLDVNGPLTASQIAEIESLANEAIYANMSIKDLYPSAEELKTIDYRSKIEIDGQVRLIVIEGSKVLDVCACCAPHVKTTAEIGIIKVVGFQSYKGGMRISILCGKRGYEYCVQNQNILSEVAGYLSTKPENVLDIVKAKNDEIAELRIKLNELNESAIKARIDSIEGVSNACVFADGSITPVTLKNIYNYMTEKFSGYVGVFAGSDAEGYRYNAGSKNMDSRELGNMMREKLDAKGGGSSEMIQGKTAASEALIRELYNSL